MTTPIFQIPPVTPQDWLILNLFGIAALSALVVLVLPRAPTPRTVFLQLRAALGLTALHPTIIAFATLLWAAMVVFLIGGVMWTIGHILTALPKASDQAEALRGLFGSLTAMGATLVGIIAAPFTLIRIRQSQKANDLTDERLFNDKLNEASKNLAAWRDVTTVLGTGDERKTITTLEPDLITRAAAIDRLHGLVEERPSEANRIAGLLALYVREHTSHLVSETPEVGCEFEPEKATPEEIQFWAQNLFPKRSDLQKAVQTLGKHRDISGNALNENAIDLSGANLQAMNLSGLNFYKSNFMSAFLQGADLSEANLQGGLFAVAQLQGSYLFKADLKSAQMFRTDVSGAEFGFADLRGMDFQEVIFDHLTSLDYADLLGASFRRTDLTKTTQITPHLDGIFGDGSNKVFPWPEHWPSRILSHTEFIRAWRAWVAENHPDVLQYLPEDPLAYPPQFILAQISRG